jgi:hypothetical protein
VSWAAIRANPSGLRTLPRPGILSWAPNHAKPFTAHPFALRCSRGPKGCRSARLRSLDSTYASVKGSPQPSPTLGDALNAGYCYLEVKCLGCDTHQTIPLAMCAVPRASPSTSLACSLGRQLAVRPEERDGKRGVGHRPQATAPVLDSTISEVATPLIEVRSAGHSGLDLRSAGRPARSRECKSLTMKE